MGVPANYDDVLDQLRQAGLQVETLEVGVGLKRCRVEGDREKRGWYALHEIVGEGGETLIVGGFGVWRGGDNNAQKVQLGKGTKLSEDQRKALAKRIRDDRRAAELAARRQAERAAERATKAWARYEPTGESAYLAAKGVQGHGVRFTANGAVVVPLLDTAGMIHGLEIIRDPKDAKARGKLAKEFWPAGLAKKGHFHLIGSPQHLVLVAEGYATAASLHEATGLPVAVAFDAGNLAPVAAALRDRYRTARIVVCADDDAFGSCRECGVRVLLDDAPTECPACGKEHRCTNIGVTTASATALEVRDTAWVRPRFADEAGRRELFLARGSKRTDFNDLHQLEGLHVVRAQVEGRLSELGWDRAPQRARNTTNGGAGEPLKPIQSLDELLERFALVYGQGGTVFDRVEHRLVSLSDMRDACCRREIARAWMEHPDREIVRVEQVGFDPAEDDASITCNLWAGWPTQPRAGKCDRLLELLRHMCSEDDRPAELFDWVLRWCAYPIQHPGAKMKTTLVIHGPQGTGKNLFFETLMAIYGRYGRVIDQSAIEDRFNDWASRKLFLIADEVVARSDLYHVKNKLKAFITGEWIRINPKNMAAYDERNHVNVVFLSNEAMPVVLEEDDRRHGVIWTPAKLGPEFYAEVLAELRDGGVEALHQYLLEVDLGDFGQGTLPPLTDAKRELIELSLDSTSRFFKALAEDELEPLYLQPTLSEDLYDVYRLWCSRCGYKNVAPISKLVNAWKRKHGVTVARKRWLHGQTTKGPHTVLFPPGAVSECPPGMPESHWLGEHIAMWKERAAEIKGQDR